jgi:hypothetical protein
LSLAITVLLNQCSDPSPCSDADLSEPFGVLDFFDIQEFLNLFSSNDPTADMNTDGMYDFFDVQLYLGLFSAGCP